MNIAIAQLNLQIGAFEENTAKILSSIEDAVSQKADLIVFSELAIGGYAAKDLFQNGEFIQQCGNSLEIIAKNCLNIACIIGIPLPNTEKGKPLFNAAVFIENGEIKHIHHKNYLPDYDVFDEYRYFQPGNTIKCFDYKGIKIGLTVCEDLWQEDKNHFYTGDVLDKIQSENPDLLINIAASPFSYAQELRRNNIFSKVTKQIKAPLIYVNQVGAYADLIFDGSSSAYNHNGEKVISLPCFQEKTKVFELNEINHLEVSSIAKSSNNFTKIGLIHQALVFGIREYFTKNNFKKAIIGLSGGLDSAVVAALTCEALGSENVLCVLMPSAYSSEHSIKDAEDLVYNTGCQSITVPINAAVNAFDDILKEAFIGYSPDVTEENIQARSRSTILMALANKLGYILLNTSNKSEAAVGYGTLYGDMAGALSVIGDVYKTEAYELAKYINREKEIIPIHTIVKPPSAELRPDQKDSDSLPPYEVLDDILFQLIENGKSKEDLIREGYDSPLISRIAGLLSRAEFKRMQAAPTLRVSPKSFGPGRQYPLVGKTTF